MIKDILRIYDTVITNWVKLYTVDGNPVETEFATADRPFVTDQPGDDDYRSQPMKSNLIVSVTRLDPQYNPKLRADNPVVWKSTDNRTALSAGYPRPYILPYQLDCRSRARTAANLWSQWIMFRMNPYFVFYEDFGPLWNTMDATTKQSGHTAVQLHLILRSIRDTTDLETGEEERWIRWSVTVELMNAFMFPVPETDDDLHDPFGIFRVYSVVRDAQVDFYTSPYTPPVPDPTLPGVELVGTVRQRVVDPTADVPVESL